jgi:hypothetical protein
MRLLWTIAAAVSLVVGTPAASPAQDHGSIDGFGGLTLGHLSPAPDFSSTLDFGGRVAVNLVPEVQAVGEFGRLGNVLPPFTNLLSSLTPLDIRASALYGEGGVRFLAAPRSTVSPYVEATAGVARLRFRLGGLGTSADRVANLLFRFADTTEPVAGVGGGVIVRGGPVVLDLGYRYKQIVANDLVQSTLGLGQRFRSNQVRVGVGVRF